MTLGCVMLIAEINQKASLIHRILTVTLVSTFTNLSLEIRNEILIKKERTHITHEFITEGRSF